jgi:hypothetical protein
LGSQIRIRASDWKPYPDPHQSKKQDPVLNPLNEMRICNTAYKPKDSGPYQKEVLDPEQ